MAPWTEGEKAAFLQMQFEAQHAYYLANYSPARFEVIVVDGEDAGRLYVARWEDDIRIIDIALLPEFRCRGVGSALLRDLLAEGERTRRPVSIHVERNNPALGLYHRLGFQLVEDRGVYQFLKFEITNSKLEI